jgi:TM2 domain-containing membrane protein YozV
MSTYPNPNAQAMFYQQYEVMRRDEVVGVLLALFLGSFGLHHFYLRRTGLGILYACFFWSGIPGIIGFFECFFMPGRVRDYNAMQAAAIAASLGIPVPMWGTPVNVAMNMPPPVVAPQPGPMTACPRCQQANVAGARFCSGCGGAL